LLIDTAGQEKHNALPMQYLRKTNYVIIVYDPNQTKEDVMDQLKHWMDVVGDGCKQAPNITIIANDKRKMSELQEMNDAYDVEDIKREVNYHKTNMNYEFTVDNVHYFKGLAEDVNEYARLNVRLIY
jgi:GTPase SAR1 family protein